jgi:hypothetical protein
MCAALAGSYGLVVFPNAGSYGLVVFPKETMAKTICISTKKTWYLQAVHSFQFSKGDDDLGPQQAKLRISVCQREACRIALGALPVQRLKACVKALTSW